jgi:recombinational DNA repair protein (RecF pathway)
MEDTIEICAGCGKMPRTIDRMEGSFICSRCSGSLTINVKADEYEKTAQELDQKFHEKIQKQRIEAAASHPVDMSKPSKKAAKSPKKAKSAKKPPKKGKR